MAEITRFFFARHLRSEQSVHMVQSRDGHIVRSGRGLAFWFMPWSTSLSEVPLDDRDLQFLFHGRSADFQDVTTQGVISWRVVDPDLLARRLDFTVSLHDGHYRGQPLEQVAQLLTEMAQQEAWAYLAHVPVAEVLHDGVERLRERLTATLQAADELKLMGLEVVTLRVSSVRPTADLEKALQTPAREAIQQEADKATFERRAIAVERERAIAENELHNKIALAKREEELIAQQGANERRRVLEAAEADQVKVEAKVKRDRLEAESASARQHIDATAAADAERLQAAAQADATRLAGAAEAQTTRELGDAKASAQKANVESLANAPRELLLGLALKELGGTMPHIEHLMISPDMLSPILGRLSDHLSAER